MHRLRHAAVQLRSFSRIALPRALAALLALAAPHTLAATASPTPTAAPLPEFYIREYRVPGPHHLQPIEIENAVYPFLGPGRTAHDVEAARDALSKAYQDQNYTSVDVEIPP